MSHTLPIEPLHDDCLSALQQGHLLIEAPTGSGKSTRLPLWALALGRVLVVQPRRLACRALARHLAAQAGEEVGGRIGYAVRFDPQWGEQTELLFATPGIALRLLADGGLDAFAVVLLDEFHERRQETDLLAALLKKAGRWRILITSATLAGERLAEWLGARRLVAEGRSFAVTLSYAEGTELPRLEQLAGRVAQAVVEAIDAGEAGDILVFLPGKGEIQQCLDALKGRVSAELIPLHAGVANAVQDRALAEDGRQRVILATNVAETSLTIPGVTLVIDSGLERRSHHRNGRSVLGLHPISNAAAEQRRGRAGRVRPGHCLRLWGRVAQLDPFTPPEVEREELTDLLLAAAAAGHPVAELDFPTPLPGHRVTQASEQLRRMGALDADGKITAHGQRLFPLPLEPQLAHLISAMPDAATQMAMVDLCATLGSSRGLLRPLRGVEQFQALATWEPQPCDLLTRIRLLREPPPDDLPVDTQARNEARRSAEQIRAALGLPRLAPNQPLPRSELLAATARALPELLFVRRLKRHDSLSNGLEEVTPARESRLTEEAEAALVFDQHSIPGRGTLHTLNLATCCAPVPLRLIAELELGEVEDCDARPVAGRIEVERRRRYAGRPIRSETTEPAGDALRRAACELILARRLCKPAGVQLRDDIAAWNLWLALGEGEGEAVEAESWLLARLTALGLEEQDDLSLIEPADLIFPGIPSWQRPDFDQRWPRQLDLPGQTLACHYHPARREVELERLTGRKEPPQRIHLPAWSGWRIKYRSASRVVDVR